ncbi:acyl carrier protein [Pelosinus fermentans]|uniref:Acyl carrier protein familyprotein n=1 Tax=Pelosinus fermentans JBW45 TaxID=1192197 RepID=I9DB69_9FIRM|nr:acyl carrier protein [Pelosinus fermentans]AJQ29669.1 acyl carrier protein familyprotein [Pelosinus fermentans JBW45]
MKKEDIFEIIARNTCEVIPELEGHVFKPSDRLTELGANSVDRAEIVAMTMEALSLQIPRVELFGAKNIGELAEVLYEKSKSV